MSRYMIFTAGHPPVERDAARTDDVLRAMFGDTAATTERMMRLERGELPEVSGTLRGRNITVRKVTQ